MVYKGMFYQGVSINFCEEDGRCFWSASVPDPSGWALAQEFCSLEEVMSYVDEKLARNRAYADRVASEQAG